MTRIVFSEIAVKGVRRWKDDAGKKHQETRKFYQTINPFNKNADGSIKTAEQIRSEIITRRDEWLGAGVEKGERG